MTLHQKLAAAVAEAGVPGAVALVAGREGVRFAGAFGMRDLAAGLPMAENTVFQLASMTKAVTSVAAMQLVERGRLGLDTPIGDVVPQLAEMQVITGFDTGGGAILRPARRPVTMRHLLTHTSGLGYDFVHENMARARGATPPAPGSLASLATPLLFDPGDDWAYGISTDWAGLAVEAASGQSLDHYFEEHIFTPLGMADTAFNPNPEQRSRQATMYAVGADGALAPFPISIGGGRNAEFLSGGGGLSGSGGDYMRFLRMLLNGGSLDGAVILQPATVAEMSRNQIGTLRAGVMETTMPALSARVEWFPDMCAGWGLGFLINPQASVDGRAPGSLAWAGLANTYYWIDPANDVAALLLMQFLPFGDARALGLLQIFERAVYGK